MIGICICKQRSFSEMYSLLSSTENHIHASEGYFAKLIIALLYLKLQETGFQILTKRNKKSHGINVEL